MKYLLLLSLFLTSLFAEIVSSQIDLTTNNQIENVEGRYDVIRGGTFFDSGEKYIAVAGTLIIEKLSSEQYGYIFVTKKKEENSHDGGFTPTSMYGIISYRDITNADLKLHINQNTLTWIETMSNAQDRYELKRVNTDANTYISLRKTLKETMVKYKTFLKNSN
jgi:hypothetical protein